jgi:transposase
MLGKRPVRQFAFQMAPAIVPETPPAELLENVGKLVDFEFVRELARPYFSTQGRPSLDPVVMVKMMLVGYLFGVHSDRRLVDECADRLSFREFLGYDLTEELPDHSSFTHWRRRLGCDFFDKVLHEIVRQCVAHGMKVSGTRCVDATAVKAQANKDGPTVVRVPGGEDIDDFLDDYFGGEAQPSGPDDKDATPINTHDPDARAQMKKGQPYGFYYQVSFSSCPISGLICDATASGFERAQTAVDHVDRDPFEVDEVCADSLYDNGDTLAQLIEHEVQPYVPRKSHDKPGTLSKDRFRYDAREDVYICPAGKMLKHSSYHEPRGMHLYTAKTSDCRDCPLKADCTSARRRTVTRMDSEWARERTVRSGPRYDELMAARNVAEHLNMLAKRDGAMRRARGLGLESICIQATLTATAIDIKKLVRWHLSSALAAILWAVTVAAIARTRGLRRRRNGPSISARYSDRPARNSTATYTHGPSR